MERPEDDTAFLSCVRSPRSPTIARCTSKTSTSRPRSARALRSRFDTLAMSKYVGLPTRVGKAGRAIMNSRKYLLLGLVVFGIAADAGAQDTKVYKEGPVTELSYIKIKPGRFDDYMKFLDTTYKQLLEA